MKRSSRRATTRASSRLDAVVRGAPELAIEIVSASDAQQAVWETKLERYRRVGLRELVRFDPDDPERPLRIWDAIDGDLVERAPDSPQFALSETLGLTLVVRDHPELGSVLRLARDHQGRDLIATLDEERDREAQGRRLEAEARERAEARVSELEAELARRR